MTNVKKKDGKRFGAIILSLILLLSLVFPYPVMADQTAADQTTAASVYAIHKTGDDKENFVIVIMGEGYTREQQEQFLKDATAKAQGLLKWSPYKEYSDRINIYAVQTVSNETGVGVMYGESNPDTYFHVQAFGKSCYFTKDGEDKARALRAELESRYLDTGAAVGTIHIICNTTANIGSSSNALFSFSANSGENEQGDVMTHEISHSIGRLGDEYDKKMQGENILFATERYDRKFKKENYMLKDLQIPFRLHQEDFAQAMGISSSMKYEKKGDHYLKKMFEVIRKCSSNPLEDQKKLWDICIFNYLIGNTDNHIKNVSLLYAENLNDIRLAPAYDMVSTMIYESSTENMSLGIGGIYDIRKITKESFEDEAVAIGVGKKFAMQRIDEMREGVQDALNEATESLAVFRACCGSA